MRKILLMVGLTLSLFSTEISINGQYVTELKNPFLAKLGTRNKSVKIPIKAKDIIIANTTTNIEEYGQPSYQFTFDKNSCNTILKRFLAEDFRISSGSNTSASCEIVSNDIKLEFFDDHTGNTHQLSNVTIDISIKLLVEKGSKILINKVLNNKMDKRLGVTGKNYNWTIRYTFDFSHKNLNETIQKITEYSIYDMLNKNINKEGL